MLDFLCQTSTTPPEWEWSPGAYFKANSFLQPLWYPSRVPFLKIDPECALSALVSDIFSSLRTIPNVLRSVPGQTILATKYSNFVAQIVNYCLPEENP